MLSASGLLALAQGVDVRPDPHADVLETLEFITMHLDEVEVTAHPIGLLRFELAPLVDIASGRRLLLHIWDDLAQLTADDLGHHHDHIFLLRSLVLWGSLQDTYYSVDPQATGEYQEVSINYTVPISRSVSNSNANLLPEKTRVVLAGERYSLPAGVVHSSHIFVRPTVTLLETIPVEIASARVFALSNLVLADDFSPRPIVSSVEVSRRIAAVVEAVSAA